MAKPTEAGTVDVNGAKLYYELRGTGPSLLFIPGAEGDAEEYLRVVELLEDEFTILSYDRRGDLAARGPKATAAPPSRNKRTMPPGSLPPSIWPPPGFGATARGRSSVSASCCGIRRWSARPCCTNLHSTRAWATGDRYSLS